MDSRKKAMILDGATDLYSLIRDILDLSKRDPRTAQLNAATEAYLKQVLAIEDQPAEPQLRLIAGGSQGV